MTKLINPFHFHLALTVLSILSALWLASEHTKKFGFMDIWSKRSALHVHYLYPGPKKFGKKPAMRNIVLRGNKPFTALVCMRWSIAGKDFGIDPYGVVQSDAYGVAVVNTYFGYGEVDFIFIPSLEAGVEATSTEEDQRLTPDVTYKPHLVQTLGLYRG